MLEYKRDSDENEENVEEKRKKKCGLVCVYLKFVHTSLQVVQYFSNMVTIERFAYHLRLRAAITYASYSAELNALHGKML